MYEQRQFMIFPVSELSKIDFTQVMETSSDTVRISTDGTKTFVKWEADEPICISTLNNPEGPYTYEEMTSILSSDEWQPLVNTYQFFEA